MYDIQAILLLLFIYPIVQLASGDSTAKGKLLAYLVPQVIALALILAPLLKVQKFTQPADIQHILICVMVLNGSLLIWTMLADGWISGIRKWFSSHLHIHITKQAP